MTINDFVKMRRDKIDEYIILIYGVIPTSDEERATMLQNDTTLLQWTIHEGVQFIN